MVLKSVLSTTLVTNKTFKFGSSSVLNLSIQWKCVAHILSLCCRLQNWMSTSLMGLERDRSMAMLYEPFGSGQTLWDRTPLNLAITMGLCDRLNVLFSEWCGSLGSDNGFTLHHLFPEALHVTRPLLFAPFWTSVHLHTFSNFGSGNCLFCCQLR